MGIHSIRKVLFRFGLMLIVLLMVIAESGVAQADEQVVISIAFDQTVATIGRTPKLSIYIANFAPHPVRVTRLQCLANGTSIKGMSINQLPSTIAVNGNFQTVQYYRAMSPGTTLVHCELTAVDTVTGATISSSSNTDQVQVLSETRLFFEAYSSTQIANVGEVVYLIAKYGNRGNTPFTNASLSCVELGRSLVFISTTALPSTITPGLSSYVEQRWQAVRSGAGPISCNLTATDSSTGNSVTLPAPMVNITVR